MTTIPLRTILQRIEPQGDEWDTARCVGTFDLGETQEAVIVPLEGHAAPISADPAELWATYRPAAEQDAPAGPEAWTTPEGEAS